jgi:hypothetical protein
MRAAFLPWFRSPRRGPSLGVCCFVFILALAIGSPLVAQVVAEPWVSAAMHTLRNSHTLTTLRDGQVVMAGLPTFRKLATPLWPGAAAGHGRRLRGLRLLQRAGLGPLHPRAGARANDLVSLMIAIGRQATQGAWA